MKIDLDELRRVVDHDDPPASALEMAQAAHCLDWHELAEKIFAEDVVVELESAKKRVKSPRQLGREAEHRFHSRVRRMQAAGVDEDDIITFGQSYQMASARDLSDEHIKSR